MTVKRVVFTGKQQVHVEDCDAAPLGKDEVRVKTHYSLMSTGTENIIFNRLFDEGTHWDKWIKYPFYPGYAAVGEIVEAGEDVKDLAPGQVVAIRRGHASEHVVGYRHVVPVPAGIPEEQAVWFALAKIAFMGAKVAKYGWGDTLLVIGAGPIGQMTIRWAAAAGVVRIVVVDPVTMRLQLAKQGGATHLISKPIAEAKEEIQNALDGQLPSIVIDTTGFAEVFAAALDIAAKYGRVIILGDTGSPAKQYLTPDVITRGLTIIGAHDGHEDERWNSQTITKLFFDHVLRGKFDLKNLNTHTFTSQTAAEAYTVANTKRGETMGLLFDWTKG